MKPFKSKKHKKKVNHLILFTTDAVDSKVKQIRLTPFKFTALVVLLCVIIGVISGCLIFSSSYIRQNLQLAKETHSKIVALEEEKEQMIAENEALNEKVAILSETVNQKVQAEQEQEAMQEEMKLPTDFPLTGSAQVEETTIGAVREADLEEAGIEIRDFDEEEETVDPEENLPVCIFTASIDTTAVASGNGTVIEISDDADFGYRVVVDHGNGYQSVYLNKGTPVVKVGDAINRGVTIFAIGDDNTRFGYQIIQDGAYINPMEMIAISG